MSYVSASGALCLSGAALLYLYSLYQDRKAQELRGAHQLASLAGAFSKQGDQQPTALCSATWHRPTSAPVAAPSVTSTSPCLCGVAERATLATHACLSPLAADLHNVILPALVSIRGRVNSHASKKCELCDKAAVIHEAGAAPNVGVHPPQPSSAAPGLQLQEPLPALRSGGGGLQQQSDQQQVLARAQVVEEEVWRKQRAEGRTVYEPFETRKVFEEAEWFLEDGSGVRVKVENALQADRLRSAMEVKSEFVAEDLSQKTLGKVKGGQMTKAGVRKTERYLPVGAVITCVGELAPNTICGPQGAQDSSSTASGAGPSAEPGSGPGPGPAAASMSGSSDASTSAPATDHSAAHSRLPFGGSSSSSMGGSAKPSSMGPMGLVVGPLAAAAKLAGPLQLGFGGGGGRGGGGRGLHPDIPYVLRKPASGPCYITPMTTDLLHAALSSTSRNCRVLACALGAVGAILVARRAWARLLQAAHERRVRARVAAVEAAKKARLAEARRSRAVGPEQQGAGVSSAATDDDEDDGSRVQHDRQAGTCVVCLDGGCIHTVRTPVLLRGLRLDNGPVPAVPDQGEANQSVSPVKRTWQ
ncbi:hypothetical protein QJQ45_009419 [Haematococcus lacustris]|nr:hypothetical protein QJQ45_009419 [Haematococcus lacustris]